MAVFRCKMCGGDLEVMEGSSFCTCEFCGARQTLPTVKDEALQTLFNRANMLRMRSEFDKAAEVYEKILQQSESEAEAYWGMILCKYGIEYVEDPKTGKRIPTCHRASYDAVITDEDYQSAIKYADAEQRRIYESEAAAIDKIQKGILALAQKEDPYDVFICYKETDESGQRTPDSVIANDIYYQLEQEGFKVFYAAITLENKLGTEYEPYIFSALNTAKVMLAIGTRPEYFNAVWVKNEWSRFLKIMKKDRSKLLIPCYRDMDPYNLPEEFAHLQAQNMSKIGFLNDLVRGIHKVIDKQNATSQNEKIVEKIVEAPTSGGIASLLKRAEIFLEDEDWERADEFCEQVLNIDPENPEAYLYKLMAELEVSERKGLGKTDKADAFSDSNNYRKVMRYGDKSLQKEISGYMDAAMERKRKYDNEKAYKTALELLDSADKNPDLYKAKVDVERAKKILSNLGDWKDSKEQLKRVKNVLAGIREREIREKELLEKYNTALELLDSADKNPDLNKVKVDVERAKKILSDLGDWKDSKEQIKKAEEGIREKELLGKAYDEECERFIQRKREKKKEVERLSDLLAQPKKSAAFVIGIALMGVGVVCLYIALFTISYPNTAQLFGILGLFFLLPGLCVFFVGLSHKRQQRNVIYAMRSKKSSLEEEIKEMKMPFESREAYIKEKYKIYSPKR